MTVTEQPDGSLLVSFSADERAAFDQAVATGAVSGDSPAVALQGFLGQTFGTLTGKIRQQMIEDIKTKLPAASIATLQTITAALT